MAKNRTNYITNYIKKNVKRYELKLSKQNDPDLIEHLSKIDNVNSYLKDLIRKDAENKKDSL